MIAARDGLPFTAFDFKTEKQGQGVFAALFLYCMSGHYVVPFAQVSPGKPPVANSTMPIFLRVNVSSCLTLTFNIL